MISGAHVVIYSRDAEADRAFFRDIFKLDAVDAGGGWLIFALPPAEVAMHPAEVNDRHEFFLLCRDVDAFMAAMAEVGATCAPLDERPWGRLTQVPLPGGGRIGVYQPKRPGPVT